jgi:hypothetical protein
MRRRHSRHAHAPRPLSLWHRWSIYLSGGVLFLTGAGWLVAHYFLRGAGLESELPHPSEPVWMRVHGAAFLVFLVAFGALLPGHVKYGLRYRLNVRTGLLVTTIVAGLALTGYGLYYLVNEDARALIGALHWVLGIGAAITLALHVVTGRALARRLRPREE